MSAALAQAAAFINAGRFDIAERLVRERLREDPQDGTAHCLLASCLRARGAIREAAAEADAGVALVPAWSGAHLIRGFVLKDDGRLADAEAAMREALRLEPMDPSVHAGLAEVLVDRGRHEEALAAAREGLAIDPHDVDCLARLALALLAMGRADDAHQAFRDALADEPSRAYLHNALGVVLLHRGQRALAEAEFTEALRLDPAVEGGQQNLALARTVGEGFTYTIRFRAWWRGRSRRFRWLSLALLGLGGFAWVGFFGAFASAASEEIRKGPWKRDLLARVAFLTLLIGLAWLVAVNSDGTRYIPPPGSPAYANDTLPLGFDQTRPDAVSSYLSLYRWASGLEVVTGYLLWITLWPLVVTRGAARAVAAIMFGVAVFVASQEAFLIWTGNAAPIGILILFLPATLEKWILRLENRRGDAAPLVAPATAGAADAPVET